MNDTVPVEGVGTMQIKIDYDTPVMFTPTTLAREIAHGNAGEDWRRNDRMTRFADGHMGCTAGHLLYLFGFDALCKQYTLFHDTLRFLVDERGN